MFHVGVDNIYGVGCHLHCLPPPSLLILSDLMGGGICYYMVLCYSTMSSLPCYLPCVGVCRCVSVCVGVCRCVSVCVCTCRFPNPNPRLRNLPRETTTPSVNHMSGSPQPPIMPRLTASPRAHSTQGTH